MDAMTWWLVAHFAATDASVMGIPAAQLHEDWERVSVLSAERIERDVAGASREALGAAEFDVRADLDGDGRVERIVAGVYETHSGESGRFLLVGKGSDRTGWRRAYLCGHPARANFSAVVVEGRSVFWFDCLHCDSAVVLRRRWGRYTLGDSFAAAYTGDCR